MSRYRKNNPLMAFDTSLAKMAEQKIEIEKPVIPIAISYARVSSDGQDVDSQLQASETWCKKENVKIVAQFTDDGIS